MKVKLKTKLGTYKVEIEPGSSFEFPIGHPGSNGKYKSSAKIYTSTYTQSPSYHTLSGSISYTGSQEPDMVSIHATIYYSDTEVSDLPRQEVSLVCPKTVVLKDKNEVIDV